MTIPDDLDTTNITAVKLDDLPTYQIEQGSFEFADFRGVPGFRFKVDGRVIQGPRSVIVALFGEADA